MQKVSTIIRSLADVEYENAQNYALKNKNKKEFLIKILGKGLLNDNGLHKK